MLDQATAPRYRPSMLREFNLTWTEFGDLLGAAEEAVFDFEDAQTGEYDATGLAEQLAWDADHDEWLDDHVHPVWDIAAWAALEAENAD